MARLGSTYPVGQWPVKSLGQTPTKSLIASMEVAINSPDAPLVLRELEHLADSGDFVLALRAALLTKRIIDNNDFTAFDKRELNHGVLQHLRNRWLNKSTDADLWLSVRTLALEIASRLSEFNQETMPWNMFQKTDSSLWLTSLELMDDTDFQEWFSKTKIDSSNKKQIIALLCNRTHALRKSVFHQSIDFKNIRSDACRHLPSDLQ